ncbi:MAG: hypothetical protein Q9163_004863 [Psora crenata]
MRQCLTSPEDGYYTRINQGNDPFGQKGDFITSPEISQIFGELLGIWLVAEWMMQGKISQGVEIIELGPGRGTLMDDLLRVRNFKDLSSSIESIHLVEASPALREVQKRLLCGDAPLEHVDNRYRSRSKYSGLPVTWYEDIRMVPNEPTKAPFIFAHEFFDALPIHAFQSVSSNPNEGSQILDAPTGPIPLSNASAQWRQPQWRELVVTPVPPPANTTTTTVNKSAKSQPDFQLSLAKASTPHSLLLPTLSNRYKKVLPQPGSVIEISPESQSYAADFARRIGGAYPPKTPSLQSPPRLETKPTASGAALILDYGPSATIPTSTLRGIRSHALVSPFTFPGLVDISADVDFTGLAEAAVNTSPGVEVHGPVEQGTWLEAMGIRARAQMICKGLDEDGKKRVLGGVERLVERGGGAMGKVYKAMAIVPERGGQRPVGFGGKVG